MKTLCKLYKYGYLILAMAACLMLASCGKESLDYNHPDVDLFVKQLKTGKYSTQSPEGLSNVPKFAKEDIEELLKYAENYEGIYFLTDEEVLDAAARYRRWWEGRKYPRTMWTIDPCYDEPLCGSSYMWW
ncbi:DUF4943 domain-containing protein [Bacteroides stercoris]|uniref:DUF4943 family protein n=1 Tax=Bacteroides stercoris TaxID=46506 RepID=UPI000E4A1380|nr:DUF4943 family protein [Bacteroides stercoris]RHL58919.1 DUF4943 domain-containing protein [Bacteroides stercoris]